MTGFQAPSKAILFLGSTRGADIYPECQKSATTQGKEVEK